MFSPEELQSIVAEAQEGLPLSVSADPEQALSPETKTMLRGILIKALKAIFTAFSGIPLPARSRPHD